MSMVPSSLVNDAEEILAGRSASPSSVLALVKKLHEERLFGLARKLLDRLSSDPVVMTNRDLSVRVAQKRALSTYKDPDLQTDAKLERALAILQGAEDLATTRDQETLGLAGAIYKRMWEHTGRERQLETSLAFYLRGSRQGVRSDFGYTGINAAFVLDVLADIESPEGQAGTTFTEVAAQRRGQAAQIRETIVAELPGMAGETATVWLNATWWFLVTVGEAYFGLGNYAESETWFRKAAALPNVSDWERESTARQLARLFLIHQRYAGKDGESRTERGRAALAALLGNVGPALESVVRGKLGLALSGGGFRASLYHIGVLARLAELDILRHIEFLSCVSGGSIIGAHYYLEIRRLLQDKADSEITRDDYIALVQRISEDFLRGVQRNIRTRIAAEWLTNLRMIFQPDYSRTKRAGELYEREIYSRIRDGEGTKKRWLNELKIFPKGENESFRPKDHNWRRANKIPILVLNATTLNTGHTWQFTATWMGEPPAGIDAEVDANYRLRRMYYEQAPDPYKRMRLGYAVAASACVPGLFEPLPLPNLYERITPDGRETVRPLVRLVDGGVHDNQGTAALLEQSCSVILVSDASGQMEDQDSPSNGLLGVPLRSNSILQSRVRVSQYEDLESRRRGGTLKGMMFVHLKKDLETRPVDWIDCQDPAEPYVATPLTSYGVQRAVQRRLAAIRTDLDSFSEAEAYSLMTSGYLMTATALSNPILGFEVTPAPRASWKFLEIEPLMREPGTATPLYRQLKVADRLGFKVWLLMRRLQLGAGITMLILLAFLGTLVRGAWGRPLFRLAPTFGEVVMALAAAALIAGGLAAVSRLVSYRKTVQEILVGLGMATVGFPFARLHLHVFDRLFLRQGRLDRLKGVTFEAAVKERSRVYEERRQSIATASRVAQDPNYVVQQSKGFLLFAKNALDVSTEAKVTETIFGLIDNPYPKNAQKMRVKIDEDATTDTELQVLPVSGTPWKIAYNVDESLKRIRIYHLIAPERSTKAPNAQRSVS